MGTRHESSDAACRLVVVGFAISATAAQFESRYPEVVEEIKALKPMGGSLFSYTPCDAGPFDADPCIDVEGFEPTNADDGIPPVGSVNAEGPPVSAQV